VLRYRLLLGTLFIALLAGLCCLDGTQAAGAPAGAWLLPLALLLALVASGEMLWLLSSAEHRLLAAVIYAGNFAIVAANGIPLIWPELAAKYPLQIFGWPLSTFALAILAAFVCEIVRYQQPGRAIANLALTILSLAYVSLLLSFVVQLRLFGSNIEGLLALVSLIAVVKMCDTGAYTVGRLIGRHKMTPRLSPGKTWEGAIGGLLFAVVGSWAVFELLAPHLNGRTPDSLEPWRWIAYGLIVGGAGIFGDLAESLLKRDTGHKDSSPWMPGFGGVLDVLDSILFAAPVAYLCWAAGLVR
jgi:phosphatidate cytidylyltransferase